MKRPLKDLLTIPATVAELEAADDDLAGRAGSQRQANATLSAREQLRPALNLSPAARRAAGAAADRATHAELEALEAELDVTKKTSTFKPPLSMNGF